MATSADSDPLLGQVIAERYAVTRRIGRGGMGAVYAARQQPLGRDVALKVIRADLAHDPEVVGRFEREARAIARLSDPHIVVVYDFGHSGGTLYLAMELLTGVSLGERLRTGGPMPLPSALRIARDICVALDAAHDAGVIHRDLKPDNIMLVTADGRSDYAKVLDFGIARITGGPDLALTSSRTVLGTPGYVAPDVIMSGMTDDPRSDLYAVGVILFEMLAGRAPFQSTSAGAMLVAQASSEPPLLSSIVGGVAAPVVELVRLLTARRPDARPPSARFVIDAIDAVTSGAPTAALFGGLCRPATSAIATSGPATLPLSSLAGHVASRETLPTPVKLDVERGISPLQAQAPHRRMVSVRAASAVAVVVIGVVVATLFLWRSSARPQVEPPATVAAVPVVAAALPPVGVAQPVVARVVLEPVLEAIVEPTSSASRKVNVTKPRPRKVVAVVDDTPAAVPFPAGPPPLTSASIKAGIVANLGKALSCTNTNIKLASAGSLLIDHCPSYATIEGIHFVSLMVSPTGEVLSARFTDNINSKGIAACALSSMKTWKLAPFAGSEPVEIKQRVVFESCIPINGVCIF